MEPTSNKKANLFNLSLTYFLSIEKDYDYTMDYMENVARAITKKYPSFLVHKKSEDKIKEYLCATIKSKVENLSDAEARIMKVSDIREIADLVAEYDSTGNGDSKSPAPIGSHPSDTPSFGMTGMELSTSVDLGASDIHPVAVHIPKTPGTPSKPKIMKRSVVRVTVELEVLMETRQYLYMLQELPELFGLSQIHNLRSRLTWKHNRARYLEEPVPIEVKVIEDHKYQRWFITFAALMILCFIGIISLFFAVPSLYKQDIHFMRSDTVNQNVSIHNSRIDLENAMFNSGAKDSLTIKDKKLIIVE